MIAHKDFESNCKRLARAIMVESRNPESYWGVVISVSKNLKKDFFEVGRAKYLKGINKRLKGFSVKFKGIGAFDCSLHFDIIE